jgi:hypothetical protein
MKAQIVEQIELFSEAELESLEFLPEELEAIEEQRVPDLDSISFEEVAKDLEVYFKGNIEEVRLERAGGSSASINVDVDVLGIVNSIKSSIKSARNREGFVKNLCNTAFYSAKQRYNVMVMNLSQGHDSRLSGVKFYASANYDKVIYGIWVFESGTFTNKGDAGYINWAFRGGFQRNGGHLKFRKR